ncbi:MAG: hypothetical protein J6S67_19010 [Methanobrevibacter sp.]|nr:hypothetical protein [Methanobrevibacter sp.]
MKRQEQIKYNEKVLDFRNDFYNKNKTIDRDKENRLYNCNATYGTAGDYIYLRSYETIVAVINIYYNTCYNFVEYEFINKPYNSPWKTTRTTSQQVSKFCKKFGSYQIIYRET